MGEVLVPVQVCGRRETLLVPRVGAQELAIAVERCFDVRPPFQFADHSGRLLSDDHVIASYVKGGETVIVKLTEGVMHDLNRRVDQIRHLQWGLVCDRLAAAKREAHWQDFASQQLDFAKLRQALEQERLTRESGQDTFRRELEAVREVLHKAAAQQPNMQREIAEVHAANEALRAAWQAEAAELRQQLVDLRQALASDWNDFSALGRQGVAEKHFEAGVKVELQAMARTVRDLEPAVAELRRVQAELQTVTRTARDLEPAVAELRRGQAHLVEQVSQGNSTLQQAQVAERNELTKQIEAVRFKLEQEVQEREIVSRIVEQISQGVIREARAREGDRAEMRRNSLSDVGQHTEGLQRAVLECQGALDSERSRRAELEERLAEVDNQGNERRRELKALMSQFAELREVYGSMKGELLGTLEELHGRLDRGGGGGGPRAEDLGKLREVTREALQREIRLRTDNDRALQEAVDQLRAGLETHTHDRAGSAVFAQADAGPHDASALSGGGAPGPLSGWRGSVAGLGRG